MRRVGGLAGMPILGLVLLALLGCGREQATPEGSPAESGQGTGDGPRPDGASALAGGPTQRKAAEPLVRIQTSLGDITVRLNPDKALLTADNFLQYVDRKHYDGTIFHQATRDYAVVGGSYAEDLTRKPGGVAIRNEAHNGLKNRRGTIAMARLPEKIDSATCEFYLNLADNPELDHRDGTPEGYGYCVFGQVVDGMDVLEKIGNVPVHDVPVAQGAPLERVPVQPVLIKSIRRVR